MKKQPNQIKVFEYFRDAFNSPSGQKVLEMLMQYYEQQFHPEMTSQQMAFHAGQRDVVHYILDMIRGIEK